MGVIRPSPVLAPDALTVFHTVCPILSDAPVFILYGPTSTTQATPAGSSRIQSHIITPLGLQSYPRLAVSPSSPLYAAVLRLPHDEQGDEISRALAYSLFKYFSEIPEELRQSWVQNSLAPAKSADAKVLFTESHAAQLASRMSQIKNAKEVLEDIGAAFQTQVMSSLDLDIVLPGGSLHAHEASTSDDSVPTSQQEKYAELVNLFGERKFIPTSRLRRAPSKSTGIGKHSALTRSQKESLRRELCEFLDTEENYVAKLYELVTTIAEDFRAKAKAKASFSSSPSEAALSALFPPSLDAIHQINLGFFEAIRLVCEETENDAIEDIEASKEYDPSSLTDGTDRTGATAFGSCLLEWFPKFSQPYTAFIQASPDFPLHLRNFTQQPSSFAKRVQETGEQKLMSLLIEPVQRLPRYSLYIDNIVKLLPLKHTALKPLLKARDVISEICAQDQTSNGERLKVQQRLRELIPSWYAETRLSSRLLTAVDLVELAAPFHLIGCEKRSLIGLLFADTLMLLERHSEHAFSARKLLSELDSPSTAQSHDAGLTLIEVMPLSLFSHVEFGNGSCIQTAPVLPLVTRPSMAQRHRRGAPAQSWSLANAIRVFKLDGSYSGSASRLSRDISKARVESRYPEALRESPTWQAHEHPPSDATLGLFSAIRERSSEQFSASVEVAVDMPIEPRRSDQTADARVSVAVEGNGFYRLEVEATRLNHRTRDMVQVAEFLPVLSRRLNNILQLHAQQPSADTVGYILHYHRDILQSIRVPGEKRARSNSKSRALLSHSPVKAMANFFSSQNNKEPLTPKAPPAANVFADITNRPRGHSKSQSESAVLNAETVNRSPSKARIVRDSNFGVFKMSREALEQTLDSYVLALHARKGNVVGRNVSGRHSAEEAIVNELYNYLLEFPEDHARAAQASIDVLFASFEKFLRNAWFEQMGLIIPRPILDSMREQEATLEPVDYEYFLVQALEELTPQNQRALRSIVALLNDLLSGTANDGDRGSLIAAVTEMVVQDSNAYEFMGLFDRFVEDQDILDGSITARSEMTTPVSGSVSTRSVQLGSVSSKASSLSRRLGLARETPNKDSVSITRFGSVLKTWGRYGTKQSEDPRSTLGRTRSVDVVNQVLDGKTTPSQRPSVFSAFGEARPQSSQSGVSVGSKQAGSRPVTPKTRRRSSLSDVHHLPAPRMSPLWSAEEISAFQRSAQKPEARGTFAQSPSTSSPLRSEPALTGSPTKRDTIVRPPSTSRTGRRHDAVRPESTPSPSDEQLAAQTSARSMPRANKQHPHKTPPVTVAGPRGVLAERSDSGNTPPPSSTHSQPHDPSASPRKMRVHSPQKIRERMQQQKESATTTGTALQAELDKISEDFAALNVQRGGSLRTPGDSSTKRDPNAVMSNLATRLKALETKLPHHIQSLERSSTHFAEELTLSLKMADRKARLLDKQLREANDTNELLFQSVQEQLDKVFESVKSGDGIETLKAQLKKSNDEAQALRRDNAKLKRDNAELRARLDD